MSHTDSLRQGWNFTAMIHHQLKMQTAQMRCVITAKHCVYKVLLHGHVNTSTYDAVHYL